MPKPAGAYSHVTRVAAGDSSLSRARRGGADGKIAGAISKRRRRGVRDILAALQSEGAISATSAVTTYLVDTRDIASCGVARPHYPQFFPTELSANTCSYRPARLE